MKLQVENEEIETNDRGGAQTRIPYRFDLVDTTAIFKLAEVLDAGAKKYGRDNWRSISAEDHINHALAHVYAWLARNRDCDHLQHAFCRLMMAVGVEEGME